MASSSDVPAAELELVPVRAQAVKVLDELVLQGIITPRQPGHSSADLVDGVSLTDHCEYL